MSEPVPPDPDELARQARQHLESLRAAGVEWLPRAEEPPPGAAGQMLFAEMNPFEGQGGLQAAEGEPGGPELTLEQRRQALTLLAEQVSTCPRCAELMATRTQTVFGDGQPGAELCFIGEAPGADEDAQGLPFVG